MTTDEKKKEEIVAILVLVEEYLTAIVRNAKGNAHGDVVEARTALLKKMDELGKLV